MKFNPKITGGLAWAGLVVVLAVPGADMLTRQPADSANRITTSEVETSRPAAVKPVVTPVRQTAAVGSDPVEGYIGSGKKLPSYISDAPADAAVAKPAPTVRLVAPAGSVSEPKTATTVPSVKPVVVPGGSVNVAAVEPKAPVLVAPQPYPASMRPKAPQVAVTKPTTTPAVRETPLIIDENLVQRREDAVAAVLDDEPVRRPQPQVVTGDQLEEWDSGSLAEYLERRGLMSESEAQAMNNRGEFDEDGFFLDEGPRNSDGRRVIRRLPRDDSFRLF